MKPEPEFKYPEGESNSKESRAERREQYLEHTTLIIPQNDGESIMIGEIADHFGIDVRRINGDWDTSKEEINTQLKSLSSFKKHIVAVELASPEIESKWEEGLSDEGSFTWIDHHKYPGGIIRVKEDAGCSLDQFLVFFGLNELEVIEKAREKGFPHDARFIHGVAINDSAFIGGMISAEYSLSEIKEIREFDRNGQYGEEKSEEIHKKNKDVFAKREVMGNIYQMDFGDDRVGYTYAKDLAIFEKLEEVDGKVVQHPVITFIIRPSIKEEGKYDIAIDLEGDDPRREMLFKGLNNIQPDRRVSPVNPQHSNHWYKADVSKGDLARIKIFMKELAQS